MLLYRILKFLVKIAVKVFYKEVAVHGKKNLPKKGPLIIAVNHPNTLMDPLVVALQLKQRTGFLANASIFANGLLKWIFGKLHLIPIYRQKDIKEGETADNADSFRKCFEYLQRKGTIMIFPEGTSVHEMKLRKIKTGTARIALGAAVQSHFQSGIKIIPISLNYSDPLRFRTKLDIRIDEPIEVDTYAETYKTSPTAAVQEITDLIKEKLEKNLIITAHKEQEVLLKRVKKIYSDYLHENNGQKLTKEAEFNILKEISRSIIYFEEKRQEEYQLIKNKITRYFNLLDVANLREGFFAEKFGRNKKLGFLLRNALYLIAFFPLYLFGLFTNYLPYIVPSQLAGKIAKDVEYRASIMMLTGLCTFPIYYTILITLFDAYISSVAWHTAIFGLSLPLLGFFTLHYWNIIEKTLSFTQYLQLRIKRSELLKNIARLRTEIIADLEKARNSLANDVLLNK